MNSTQFFLLINLLTGQPAGDGIQDSSYPTISACAAVRQALMEASNRTTPYQCRVINVPGWTQGGHYVQVPPPIIDTPIYPARQP